ncbi:hypothetical protein THIOKS11490013 [Thiocapsa sp. KS1]|nr:hypothetical protein THIOKS11490013 [Thiocapsa sp. KS1]
MLNFPFKISHLAYWTSGGEAIG